MNKLTVFVGLIVVFLIFSCNKNNMQLIDLSKTEDSLTVNVNTCVSKNYFGNLSITYCLDSVTYDCRCPEDVTCFWAGYASANFRIVINNNEYRIQLSTLKFQNIPSDTTLEGVKIQFFNLLPYPNTNYVRNYKDYTAVLKVYK